MRVLIVGGGGREHALAWKIQGDSCRPQVFCAPGNAGTASCARNLPIAADDLQGLEKWCVENKPDLVVVGPEVPLCLGLTDRLAARGINVFGPVQAAARLEGSKAFSKEVMLAAGVPTARAEKFSDAAAARRYVEKQGAPLVLKADGLCAGKGVFICKTVEEALQAIEDVLVQGVFGNAGAEVLIEDFLDGEEASILGLVDGEHVVLLESSQDHKRIFDRDEGPNTGGMGAYSPAPVVTQDMWPFIKEQVFLNLVRELKRRGIVYKGVLYAGLMFTAKGPKVLEYNCRFGDPETQVVLPRWKGDILPALMACVKGTLRDDMVQWHSDPAAGVVMASGGYPGDYVSGKPIQGLEAAGKVAGAVVFHAGTRSVGGEVVTAGGRVLCVSALGRDLESAVSRAYEAVRKIHFDGAHYRTDIAARAFGRV